MGHPSTMGPRTLHSLEVCMASNVFFLSGQNLYVFLWFLRLMVCVTPTQMFHVWIIYLHERLKMVAFKGK